jgi:hypothetical protein
MEYVRDGETISLRRRMEFDVRLASNAIDPANGEAGQQPQISVNNAAFGNAGIGVLTLIGNGRYWAEVSTDVLVAGNRITGRYKGALTVETPSREDIVVVAYDPYDVPSAVNTALSDAHGSGDWTGANKLIGVAPGSLIVPIGDAISAFVGTRVVRVFEVTGGDYAAQVWSAFTFAIKRDKETDDDDAALVLIRETNPADAGDGLIRQNGMAVASAAGASIAVENITDGLRITVTIGAAAMLIPPSLDPYHYELKRYAGADNIDVPAAGEFLASRTVYRSVTP